MQDNWTMNEPFTHSEVAEFITECIWLGLGVPTADELVEFCHIGKKYAELILKHLNLQQYGNLH